MLLTKSIIVATIMALSACYAMAAECKVFSDDEMYETKRDIQNKLTNSGVHLRAVSMEGAGVAYEQGRPDFISVAVYNDYLGTKKPGVFVQNQIQRSLTIWIVIKAKSVYSSLYVSIPNNVKCEITKAFPSINEIVGVDYYYL